MLETKPSLQATCCHRWDASAHRAAPGRAEFLELALRRAPVRPKFCHFTICESCKFCAHELTLMPSYRSKTCHETNPNMECKTRKLTKTKISQISKWRYGTRVPDIKSRKWRCRNVKWIKLKYSFPRCVYLMPIGMSKFAKRAEQPGMHGRGSEPGFQLACKCSASKSASHHVTKPPLQTTYCHRGDASAKRAAPGRAEF